jgi:dihydrofolate synthase/folylpolyglutamate synthase
VPPVPGRLHGGFQRENARLALGAIMLLAAGGLPVDAAAMAAGLADAEWPGRFELVPGAPPVLIDGAHNGDSAQKLLAAIKAELRFRQLILVLGTSRDKDIEAIVAALVPAAAAVVITRSTHPRAMDLDRVAAIARPHLRGPLALAPEIGDALAQARTLAAPDDLICVTGSLFVVAAAREALGLAVAD